MPPAPPHSARPHLRHNLSAKSPLNDQNRAASTRHTIPTTTVSKSDHIAPTLSLFGPSLNFPPLRAMHIGRVCGRLNGQHRIECRRPPIRERVARWRARIGGLKACFLIGLVARGTARQRGDNRDKNNKTLHHSPLFSEPWYNVTPATGPVESSATIDRRNSPGRINFEIQPLGLKIARTRIAGAQHPHPPQDQNPLKRRPRLSDQIPARRRATDLRRHIRAHRARGLGPGTGRQKHKTDKAFHPSLMPRERPQNKGRRGAVHKLSKFGTNSPPAIQVLFSSRGAILPSHP